MDFQDDSLIHLNTITQILIIRGYLSNEQLQQQFQQSFIEQLQEIFVEIEIKYDGSNDKFFEENLKRISQQQVYQTNQQFKQKYQNTNDNAICVYIPVMKKLTNFDIFKKYINKYNQIFVFCDDSVVKQIKNRFEKTLQESESGSYKRIDVFNFDNILINLYQNSHSPLYTVATNDDLTFINEILRIQPKNLPKIQINDPLLMYYGFNKHLVVKQHSVSETTAGEKLEYLYTIPPDPHSIYLSFVLTNF